MKPSVKMACITLIAASGPLFGQAFEVASIRTSTPLQQAIADGSLTGMKISGGRVSFGHTPLAKLIRIAYGITPDQLVGPDWLDNPMEALREGGMFDIEAKLPDGATADQVPVMLQALLADRFKLTIRRESHQTDTYALIVGKNGPKFQKKDPPAKEPDQPAPGQKPPVKFGASTMTSIPGGALVEASTIQGLVDHLAAMLPLPVVDKTGLKGNYDIKMEIHPLGPAPGAPLDLKEIEESARSSAIAGVEKLGLKLEAQKNPVETIVVEHVERTPTGN